LPEYKNRIIGHGTEAPDQLLANPANWRIHPQSQQDALKGALDSIGYIQSVIVNQTTGHLIDGHLRVMLAMRDNSPSIPVCYVELTEAEEALALATIDPLSAMAAQDNEKLLELMHDVQTDDPALQQMLADLIGDGALAMPGTEGQTDEDAAPEPQDDAISERGKIYRLGNHKLMCGDSTSAEDVAALMDGNKAVLIHADPPYGMGKEKDGIENDNLYADKLDAFQMAWWRTFRPHTENNGSAYIWGNAEDLWRLWYVGGLKDSERLTMRNEIVWAKGSAGAGGISHIGADGLRLYPQETERCLFFMLGEQGFNNNADNYWDGWENIRQQLFSDCEKMGWGPQDIKRICGVGMFSHWFTKSQWTFIPEEHYKKLQEAAREHDAFKREHDDLKREFYETRAFFDNTHDNMTDVWDFTRVTGEERHGHATPKPVAMLERAVKSSAPKDSLVVEPFLGSGSTLIACEKTGRVCYGMEIAPNYCDVIRKRWAEFVHGKDCDWQELTPKLNEIGA
jgi:DNA modification methylase